MPELRSPDFVLGDLVIGNSIQPALLHGLLRGGLNALPEESFADWNTAIKTFLRDIDEEQILARKLGNVLLYSLVTTIVLPLEDWKLVFDSRDGCTETFVSGHWDKGAGSPQDTAPQA